MASNDSDSDAFTALVAEVESITGMDLQLSLRSSARRAKARVEQIEQAELDNRYCVALDVIRDIRSAAADMLAQLRQLARMHHAAVALAKANRIYERESFAYAQMRVERHGIDMSPETASVVDSIYGEAVDVHERASASLQRDLHRHRRRWNWRLGLLYTQLRALPSLVFLAVAMLFWAAEQPFELAAALSLLALVATYSLHHFFLDERLRRLLSQRAAGVAVRTAAEFAGDEQRAIVKIPLDEKLVGDMQLIQRRDGRS
jgi:hypothetical protein